MRSVVGISMLSDTTLPRLVPPNGFANGLAKLTCKTILQNGLASRLGGHSTSTGGVELQPSRDNLVVGTWPAEVLSARGVNEALRHCRNLPAICQVIFHQRHDSAPQASVAERTIALPPAWQPRTRHRAHHRRDPVIPPPNRLFRPRDLEDTRCRLRSCWRLRLAMVATARQ
jgi:hypothetical protein